MKKKKVVIMEKGKMTTRVEKRDSRLSDGIVKHKRRSRWCRDRRRDFGIT